MVPSERGPGEHWGPRGVATGGRGAEGQLHAQLPTPGFHGYLRAIFLGSEAGAVAGPGEAGEACTSEEHGGGAASPPLQALPWAKGWNKGMASSARENRGQGWRGERRRETPFGFTA